MDRPTLSLSAAAMALAVACAVPASAQTFDHLSCQRISGDPALEITADIDALDDRFDADNCQLGKAKLLCEPAARTAVDPTPPFAFMQGQELGGDYLCYKLECEHQPTQAMATDLFGPRGFIRLRSDLPAYGYPRRYRQRRVARLIDKPAARVRKHQLRPIRLHHRPTKNRPTLEVPAPRRRIQGQVGRVIEAPRLRKGRRESDAVDIDVPAVHSMPRPYVKPMMT